MKVTNRDVPLIIGITDRETLGFGGIAASALEAFRAGLPCLMLREKDLPDEEILPLAGELAESARENGARLIINRRINVARSVGAAGVHLGADGPTLEDARAGLGKSVILGYSAHSEPEALDAFSRGADYVIYSPVFSTPSKDGILKPIGLEGLASLVDIAPGPVIGLGGIDESNIGAVARTGAAGAAMIRAIFGQGLPGTATREILKAWHNNA